MTTDRRYVRIIPVLVLALAGGCTMHPAGEMAERRAARQAGAPFVSPVENRPLAPLPAHASADDLVRRALLVNGVVEQRYWEWRSAIEQIPQDGTPQTTLAINAAMGIDRGRISAAGTVLTAQNMPSAMVPWPGKLAVAAKRALENARAAGERFRAAQFELRRKVLTAYDDYALAAALVRLGQSDTELLQTTVMLAEARNRAGSGAQADLLKARNELDLSRNDLANMRSQVPIRRASLNALLDRAPDAPLAVPADLPATRALVLPDSQLLALAARRNPQLAALQRQMLGRKDAIERARLEYYPDFMVGISTDLAGIAQQLMGMVSVPLLRHEAIDAAIAQARADLRAIEANRRQTTDDLAAQLVMDVTFIRDADRQLDLFAKSILPRAQQLVDVSRAAYEAGRSSLLDLLDSQRSLIAIRRLVANLRTSRDQRVAGLEAIVGQPLAGGSACLLPAQPGCSSAGN